tara:strand:+ start:115 stop:393 length:279 start_codon:yes stop_codon:yes gene_type:complete
MSAGSLKRIINNVAYHSAYLQGMQELRSLFREKFRPYDENGEPRQFYCEIYERWQDFEYETWCEVDSVFHERIKKEEELVRYWKERMNEVDK